MATMGTLSELFAAYDAQDALWEQKKQELEQAANARSQIVSFQLDTDDYDDDDAEYADTDEGAVDLVSDIILGDVDLCDGWDRGVIVKLVCGQTERVL
jgi:hypothetical protein